MVSILAIGLAGCSWDSDGALKSKVVKTESTVTLNEFDVATGAVTKDTELSSKETGTSMTLSEGTVLKDEDGNPITKAPRLKVNVAESERDAKTTLDFSVDGKRVIPTEPVMISLPAPAGAKPGDSVEMEVPDDGSIDNVSSKMMVFIVDAKGKINIRLFPNAFKHIIVIVVKLKQDNSTN